MTNKPKENVMKKFLKYYLMGLAAMAGVILSIVLLIVGVDWLLDNLLWWQGVLVFFLLGNGFWACQCVSEDNYKQWLHSPHGKNHRDATQRSIARRIAEEEKTNEK